MKIQPIKTVFNGELTELKIRVNGFDIEECVCAITWVFYNPEGAEVKSGNYTLTDEEYELWGIEDNYIFNVFKAYFLAETDIEIVSLDPNIKLKND